MRMGACVCVVLQPPCCRSLERGAWRLLLLRLGAGNLYPARKLDVGRAVIYGHGGRLRRLRGRHREEEDRAASVATWLCCGEAGGAVLTVRRASG
ncbi:hypothetical protein PRIC1_008131 [Phytophthora ramorum]